MCDHNHTKEHIHYYERDDEESSYTLKHRLVVCVDCLHIMLSHISRVGWVVINSKNQLVRIHELESDAKTYASLIHGTYKEYSEWR